LRYILQVSTRALAGREEEFNRWYGEVHVGEVLAVPGFSSCRRFTALGMDGQPTGEFIALYEVDTDDPAALLNRLFAASPTMRMTDAIDPASPRFSFLAPCEDSTPA